jgi:hypothetical protein
MRLSPNLLKERVDGLRIRGIDALLWLNEQSNLRILSAEHAANSDMRVGGYDILQRTGDDVFTGREDQDMVRTTHTDDS